jgi:hypothetical protein
MQAAQRQRIQSYRRVLDFLAMNAPPQPPANYAVQKQVLETVVEHLSDFTSEQVTGARLSKADSRRLAGLRRTLREHHLQPIARIARALLPDAIGIEKALKMPTRGMSSVQLADEADGVRGAIEPYTQVFLENGEPADFMEQLALAAKTLREAVMGKARNIGRHVGAKAGLEQELKRGRRAVDLLDAIVTRAFRGNGVVLAKWRAAKRVQDQRGPSVGTTAATADQNPAVPQTAA